MALVFATLVVAVVIAGDEARITYRLLMRPVIVVSLWMVIGMWDLMKSVICWYSLWSWSIFCLNFVSRDVYCVTEERELMVRGGAGGEVLVRVRLEGDLPLSVRPVTMRTGRVVGDGEG